MCDLLHREIRTALPALEGLEELYEQLAYPQAMTQRRFRYQAEDQTLPLYTDDDLVYLISRVRESFTGSSEH